MAYSNNFYYDRDSSVDDKYSYVEDLSIYKPIYGSSVDFVSRLNFLETVDNALKILPASENNLTVRYNFIFLLTDVQLGNLLKTIEVAGGYRYLKFYDPSNIYKNIIGLVEDYSISKTSNNLSEFRITISSYIKSPIFNWSSSSFLNYSDELFYFMENDVNFSKSKILNKYYNLESFTYEKKYKKYESVYADPVFLKNFFKINVPSNSKMDNFWFSRFDHSKKLKELKAEEWQFYFTRNFIYEPKLPFNLQNKFDVYQMEYKNSFIQNIKHKNNSNSLKKYELKFENISDDVCKSILFFLEKKCGYKRFIYEFPIFLNKHKVFICIRWTHVFKYENCHEITAELIEDPNPNIFLDDRNFYHLI